MRVVDGMKVAFVGSESYFAGFDTPSMYRAAKETGADVVFLLAPGKTEADLSDDDIRNMLSVAMNPKPEPVEDDSHD